MSSFVPCMPGSRPSIAARHGGPALRFHQLGPASIELAVIALAHAEIAGPGFEVGVEALVPETHLRIDGHAPRDGPATGPGAFLPVVHVLLLEGAGRAEASHPAQPHRFLDMRRSRLVGVDPGPNFGLIGPAR